MIKVIEETLKMLAILIIFSMGVVGLAAIMIGENENNSSGIEP